MQVPKSLRASLVGLPLILSLASALNGCQAFFDLSPAQCQIDKDCEARGTAFSGMVCEDSVCVMPSGIGGETGTGGSGTGGSSGPCKTHLECTEDNLGSPTLCRSGACVPLTLPIECPLVLGVGKSNSALDKGDPIVLGAYASVDSLNPRKNDAVLNYELAVNEFNNALRGGLLGGSGGKLRPILLVVCNSDSDANLELSSAHLYETLQVPGVIGALYSANLWAVFQQQKADNGALFVSPFESDNTLASPTDGGLLWSLLPPAKDLAPVAAALATRIEKHLRTVRPLDESAPLKVALVEARTPFLQDLAEALFEKLTFNGVSAVKNQTAGHLLRITTDSAVEGEPTDLPAAIEQLGTFRPDLVIGMSSGEFGTIWGSYEANYGPSDAKPFYLIGPYLYSNSDFAQVVAAGNDRILGVNFAPAPDPSLYNSYYSRLQAAYPNSGVTLEGTENFYDAAYLLMYATAGGTVAPSLSGSALRSGLLRVLSGDVEGGYAVGPANVGTIAGMLQVEGDQTVQLIGTMGPLEFDMATGARSGTGVVYCFQSEPFTAFDAMTYNNATGLLEGSPACVPGFTP